MTPAIAWLEPLRSSVPELGEAAWEQLRELSTDLAELVVAAPAGRDPARSKWLLELRQALAERGHRAPTGVAGSVWQILAQFCAGFHDLDLRDAIGSGHGAMVVNEAGERTAAIWRTRLNRGDLVGIAATERHGGSRIREITTSAHSQQDGRWRVLGEKCWVSRLVEASGFVVFFRAPDGPITAAVVDASDSGLERELFEPFGLNGWSWGVLRLHDVLVDPANDLVGRAGSGLQVFRRHFGQFRPLVTATALGTAAGVHTFVTDSLAAACRSGVLPRVRDNALITLGRTYAEINAALLAAITATRLASAGHPSADLASQAGKAMGVDIAYQATADLAPLLGARGFQQDSPIAKARADLTGMLYADGIHDSLYRAGGIDLIGRRLPSHGSLDDAVAVLQVDGRALAQGAQRGDSSAGEQGRQALFGLLDR
jgi:alkylation response protein AidB-like acyl-CoA dehydrogenase